MKSDIYRFPFKYGEFDEDGELMVFWMGANPEAFLIATGAAEAPKTLSAKAMVAEASKVSGLKLQLKVAPWKQHKQGQDREVRVLEGNDARLMELFSTD